MACVAIISFWDCGELIPYAVSQWHKNNIDVMICYSNTSNYGEIINNTAFLMRPEFSKCILVKCEPMQSWSPVDNERRKRNYGLQKAREMEFTHFISCDADELYEPFKVDWEAAGTVVVCQTYFKKPTLTIGLDHTLISFIHKLTPTIKFEFNRNYPFAFDSKGIHIDPTRQMNINSGVQFRKDIVCHHLSYVRENINRKIENSTARNNIRKSVVLKDLELAAPSYYCQYYEKTLVEVPNTFGIPEF